MNIINKIRTSIEKNRRERYRSRLEEHRARLEAGLDKMAKGGNLIAFAHASEHLRKVGSVLESIDQGDLSDAKTTLSFLDWYYA